MNSTRPCLQMVDTSLDFHLAALHEFPEGWAVLQQELHRAKDVHTHCVGHQLVFDQAPGHQAPLQPALATPDKPTSRPSSALPALLEALPFLLARYVAVAPATAPHLVWPITKINLDPNLPTAELQATNHAAFRMGASVACIPQDKQITWHGIEHGVNWHTGICAAKDGGVGCLPMAHQSFTHLESGVLGQRSTNSKALVTCLQHLQSFLGRNCTVYRCAHSVLTLCRQGHSQKSGHPDESWMEEAQGWFSKGWTAVENVP